MVELDMKIDANTLVDGGFPPDEGKHLAEQLLSRTDLSWNGLELDVSKCAPSLIISAFINGFLQEVFDSREALLETARKIQWTVQFDFQRENVARWVKDFEPYIDRK